MRDHALAMLRDFTPRMGRRYAAGRNHDRGAGNHHAVSRLSPYVRRRVVLEQELVEAAIAGHGLEGAEKFVQEVFWRGYFKGWLERRPGVWEAYRQGLADDLAALAENRRLRKQVERAEDGATGLDCFDSWVQELVETGYLHNHARMWFASIWIFTFGLPWRIGADFFYRHLLDGDPASNTLGWRWVAGLHTRGKAYRAEAWNIAKFTDRRFAPRDADLADGIEPLDRTEPQGLPPAAPVRPVTVPDTRLPTGLLFTEEDCLLETFALPEMDIRGASSLAASTLRSERPVAEAVQTFEAGALADASARAGRAAVPLDPADPSSLGRWARSIGAEQVATGYVPQGPVRDWLDTAAPSLGETGIVLAEWRRPWDEEIWHHATAGFFKVKKQIPAILDRIAPR